MHSSRNQRKQRQTATGDDKEHSLLRHNNEATMTISTKEDADRVLFEPMPGRVCWHCCHEPDKSVVYIPHKAVSSTTYEVYGYFCSVACARAFLFESATFDSNRQLLLLNKVAVDVYGLVPPFAISPPRLSLQLFGGPFDIETFRQKSKSKKTRNKMTLPPFSLYTCPQEEEAAAHIRLSEIPSSAAVCRIEQTPKQKKKEKGVTETAAAPERAKKGGLGKFMVAGTS